MTSDVGEELNVISPSIQYKDAKPSRINSATYAFDSRLRSCGDRTPSMQTSPQLELIKGYNYKENQGAVDTSRGRTPRTLFWGKKGDDDYTTYRVRRLSPKSKKAHRQFWNQMDDMDSVTDGSTDDSMEVPFDVAKERALRKRTSSFRKRKVSISRPSAETNGSCGSDFLNFLSCGCVGIAAGSYPEKEVKINPVPVVHDYKN